MTRLGCIERRLLRAALVAAVTLQLAASARAQTINVEVDYMATGGHSHLLGTAEVDAVVQMFACQGFTLNLVVDDQLTETTLLTGSGGVFSDFFTRTGANSFKGIKDANFSRGSDWHYCIMGHQYQVGSGPLNSSGLAEVSGDDCLVTLAAWSAQTGTAYSRAATFAHELGHNLGLEHWGGSPDAMDAEFFKPNYPSVMSYQYQMTGVRDQLECTGLVGTAHLYKTLDYSNGSMPFLNENALDEELGVHIQGVDWDCDLTLDSADVSQDVSSGAPWCNQTGNTNTIWDHNDWANLDDPLTRWAGESAQRVAKPIEVVTCITYEEATRQSQSEALQDPSNCNQTQLITLVTESCETGRMIWVDDDPGDFAFGTGDDPYDSLPQGLSLAPDGSVIYLQPGTYTLTAGTTIDQPVTITGPGKAGPIVIEAAP